MIEHFALPSSAWRKRAVGLGICVCTFWVTGIVPIARSDCVGDVDGNGRTELSDLARLLTVFGTICNPPECTQGDLDDDGRVTLADLAILLSDFGCTSCGPGALFDQLPGIAVPSPVDLAVADFDLDGDRDAAVSSFGQSAGAVHLLRAGGAGSFVATPTSLPSLAPWGVALGNLNSDNVPDLVSSIFETGQINISYGLGDATFAPPIELPPQPVAETALHVLVAELDGAAPADIAVNLGNGARLYWNDGAGLFSTLHLPAPATRCLSAAQLTGDSLAEILVCDASGNLNVFVQSEPRSFAAPAVYDVDGSASDVEAGFLDSDASRDVAVLLAGSPYEVALFWGVGQTGLLEPGTRLLTGARPLAMTLGDFNGDSQTDIAVACSLDDSIYVFLNAGNRSFAPPHIVSISGPVWGMPYDIVATELTGDGRTDLLVSLSVENAVATSRNCRP